MLKQWLTFGMSAYDTPGFQDTSRLMSNAFPGPIAYIEPPKPFHSWRHLDGTVFRWSASQRGRWTVLTPPLPIPRKLDPLKLAITLQAADCARKLAKAWGPDWRSSTAFYVTNWTPFQVRLIEALKPTHLVFDIVDDVLAFPYAWDRDAVRTAWRQLAAMASVVLAVSPTLQRQVETDLGAEATYCPNGVDAKRFMNTPADTPQRLATSRDRLRAGFAGTLNHWIDFTAFSDLATAFPEVDFYLMGRTGHFGSEQQQAAFAQLKALTNVFYLGSVPYDELPGYLHEMNVLLLPRIPSPASASSSPLKLFEYLAVGKPIVTSGVPVSQDMGSLMYAAANASGLRAEFLKALAEVNGASENRKTDRQAYALRHTWEERMKLTLEALGQHDGKH